MPLKKIKESAVNTTRGAAERENATAALSDGKYVVVWETVNQQAPIRARVFNADGTPASAQFAVNGGDGFFSKPSVVALANGDFVVTWSQGSSIDGRIFGSDGRPEAAAFTLSPVLAFGKNVSNSEIHALADGGFVAVWDTNAQAPTIKDAIARIFNGDGTPRGEHFIVSSDANVSSSFDQELPDVTALNNGQILIVYQNDVGSTTSSILGRLVNADGSFARDNFKINSINSLNLSNPKVTALADGGYAVTWTNLSGGGSDVWVRRFDADGKAIGVETMAHTFAAGQQSIPEIEALKDGRLAVSWTERGIDGDAIKLRIFNTDGKAAGDEITVKSFPRGGATINQDITVLKNGMISVSWLEDPPGGVIEFDIKTAVFNPNQFIGTSGANRWTGGSGKDTITGDKGNDRLNGAAGNDSVSGGTANDIVSGGTGNDKLFGDSGNDTLAGGSGADRILGGSGVDVTSGGTGADVFDYDSVTQSGVTSTTRDEVKDFAVDVDRLDFSTIDAEASTTANDDFSFIGTNAFSAEGQIRAIARGADTIVLINSFGTGKAELSLKLLGVSASSLDAADFIL
jgi:Ca2+-binding RTX toxin-like protein